MLEKHITQELLGYQRIRVRGCQRILANGYQRTLVSLRHEITRLLIAEYKNRCHFKDRKEIDHLTAQTLLGGWSLVPKTVTCINHGIERPKL
jgi:hypothetical protein